MADLASLPAEQFNAVRATLLNTSSKNSLAQQFRALFTMKAIGQAGDNRAIDTVGEALLTSDSALLKHELAYVLGQIKRTAALPVLDTVLRNDKEDPMVRHEAAEALGAISSLDSIPILREYFTKDGVDVSIKETCDIAIRKIEHDHRATRESDGDNEENAIPVIDPAPAPPSTSSPTASALRTTFLDASLPLFERYRSMFGLRNIALHSSTSSPAHAEAIAALADGFADASALFRHEIAYIFGQLSSPESVPALLKVLRKEEESEMVRHEAAEALGGIGAEGGAQVKEALEEFAKRADAPRVVRESCEVALDMWEYEASGDFQYADGLEKAAEGQTAVAAA